MGISTVTLPLGILVPGFEMIVLGLFRRRWIEAFLR